MGAKSAIVVRNGAEVEVPVEAVVVGDMVREARSRGIPTNGVVKEGESSVDESMLTGESVPSTNARTTMSMSDDQLGGLAVVEVTRVGTDTALARISRLVEEAQTRKAPIEHLADRVASVSFRSSSRSPWFRWPRG